MKLSQLIPQDKIKLAAELDGWDNCYDGYGDCVRYGGTESESIVNLPLQPYLTSYDAIIPLIQKQDIETRRDVYRALHREKYKHDTDTTVRFTVDIGNFINFTPSQLLDALLVATGKAEL